MARIRSIKPDLWSSEQFVECSSNARLLFIGSWNFADDGGTLPAKPLQLKMQVFPGDMLNKHDILELVRELIGARLFVEFEASDGARYWHITGWRKHQKIDRPNPRYPRPDDDGSKSTSRQFVEDSSSALPRREGRREGRKGKEGKEGVQRATPQASLAPSIPLKDGSEFTLTDEDINQLVQAYPGLAVMVELEACRAWNVSNPPKRKTRAGIMRHVNSWLSRAAKPERAPTNGPHKQTPESPGERAARKERAVKL